MCRKEGRNLIQAGRMDGWLEEQIRKGNGEERGACKYVYVLIYIVKSRMTPSHLSHILQGVLVVLVGQAGQEAQFFHNLVIQVSQVTLEVLWVQQLSPLLVPMNDKKYYLECINFTAAGPSSLVATFSEGRPLHHCSDTSHNHF